MKILIPHPPGPLLLQEKWVEGNLGDSPRPPPERLGLSGLSAIIKGGFHKRQSLFGGVYTSSSIP
jgi:hypothetical protein